MASSYPGALDAFTNPVATDTLDNPSHSDQHTNINDAMEAVQAELGTDPAGTFATVKARLDALQKPATIRVRRATSAQSIANNTLVTVIYNTLIREDDEDGDFTFDSITGEITVNRSGWYLITAGILWGSSSVGERFARVFVGASEVVRSTLEGFGQTAVNINTLSYAAATEKIYVQARQQSGAALDVQDNGSSFLAITRIRD